MLRLIFLILSMAVISAQALSQEAGQQMMPAPDFALKDLEGKTVGLKNYRGKVVLLNFWATWCVPCRVEIPDLVRLQKEYQSGGLQVVGITYPEYRLGSVQRMASRLKVNYPILLGTRELAAKYAVAEVLPVTIVVDREGKIRAHILGILGPEEFDQNVKPLLDKQDHK
jgi:thiol-disulfide isomerase/thioredoxin